MIHGYYCQSSPYIRHIGILFKSSAHTGTTFVLLGDGSNFPITHNNDFCLKVDNHALKLKNMICTTIGKEYGVNKEVVWR